MTSLAFHRSWYQRHSSNKISNLNNPYIQQYSGIILPIDRRIACSSE